MEHLTSWGGRRTLCALVMNTLTRETGFFPKTLTISTRQKMCALNARCASSALNGRLSIGKSGESGAGATKERSVALFLFHTLGKSQEGKGFRSVLFAARGLGDCSLSQGRHSAEDAGRRYAGSSARRASSSGAVGRARMRSRRITPSARRRRSRPAAQLRRKLRAVRRKVHSAAF